MDTTRNRYLILAPPLVDAHHMTMSDQPRFQFSLGNVLWAMTWMAVCGGAYSLISRMDRAALRPWLNDKQQDLIAISTLFSFLIVAIGALFGRTKAGLKVGFGLLLVVLLLLLQVVS